MPRQARIDAPGALHHIIIRGIERNKIFHDNKDRNDFLARMGDILKETSTGCFGWALIPNHVHLLLRTGTVPIATVMRRLLTGYAVTFNRKHNRHGHLFQNRYKSILCQEDPYFLELVRYIHLNPLRAGLVKDFDALGSYAYCGHSVILGKQKNDWQDTDYVLAHFASEKDRARREYCLYVQEGVGRGRRPDLVGGGLIRSHGGWQEVERLRNEGVRVKGDERILGDSSFVLEILGEAEERLARGHELESRGFNIEQLAIRVADIFGVDARDIFKAGKYKKIVPARSVFCYWAVRELGVSGTALAARLGMTQPAVSISVRRGGKIVEEMGLQFE
ncbi:MAG: transposase [Deltaproteobacteria bacterium]|nr:transposase [Deltaproteobacteria bacterium]MBW2072261.1 transposase [Deltaproteobacteria bacterium]